MAGKRRPPATDESELLAAAAFRTALRRFLHRTESVAAEAGLTPQRYDLLLMIRSAGELRVTELCELLHLQQTAVTELVNRTEEAGLIVRRPSREDGGYGCSDLQRRANGGCSRSLPRFATIERRSGRLPRARPALPRREPMTAARPPDRAR